MDAVGVTSLVFGFEGLQTAFDFVDGGLIEQFAEVGVTQNFLELGLIDGESLGATLGERGIAFVDVVGDVGEKERGSEGRRLFGSEAGDANGAALDGGEQSCGGGKIEDIANTLAIGFEKNREGGETRGDGEQVGGAFALLPERSTHSGAALRKKESAGGGFAKFCGEERSGAELAEDQLLEFGWIRN